MATLAELAKEAGVSISTVSRVLNQKSGVSDSARERVLSVVSGLTYTRRGLDTLPGSGVVGLLVPELSNPIFPAFAEALETIAAAAGYSTLLCNTRASSLGEEQYVRMLLARGVRGMVFVSPEAADVAATHSHYEQLLAEGVTMVFVNGHAPVLDIPDMRVDLRVAGYLGARHLAGLGHRAIGFVSGPSRSLAASMMRSGWESALAECELRADQSLVANGSFSAAGGADAVAKLLETSKPSAVICSSDHMALGAIAEAHRRGVRVPDDLSVVGFDDMPLAANYSPALTTLAQPVSTMAQSAVDELVTRLRTTKPAASGPQSKVFRPQLVVRESTTAP